MNNDLEKENIEEKTLTQRKREAKRTDFLYEKTREVYKDYCAYLENKFEVKTDLIFEQSNVSNSMINYNIKFFVNCVLLDKIDKEMKEQIAFYYNKNQDPNYELLKKQFMKIEERKNFVKFLRRDE